VSAYWKLESTSDSSRRIIFTWTDRSSTPFRIESVGEGEGSSVRGFQDQDEAEAWATQLGVESWRVVEFTRSVPIPLRIPIEFKDGPPESTLRLWRDEILGGKRLKDLAVENNRPPTLIRAYILGFDPSFQCIR
jgi:hypothetical protein